MNFFTVKVTGYDVISFNFREKKQTISSPDRITSKTEKLKIVKTLNLIAQLVEQRFDSHWDQANIAN